MAACREENLFAGNLLELSLDPGSRGQDIQRQKPGSQVVGPRPEPSEGQHSVGSEHKLARYPRCSRAM